MKFVILPWQEKAGVSERNTDWASVDGCSSRCSSKHKNSFLCSWCCMLIDKACNGACPAGLSLTTGRKSSVFFFLFFSLHLFFPAWIQLSGHVSSRDMSHEVCSHPCNSFTPSYNTNSQLILPHYISLLRHYSHGMKCYAVPPLVLFLQCSGVEKKGAKGAIIG